MSELLEPAGAGQPGSEPLPHPPGTDPAENTRGEGWPGTEGQSWGWPRRMEKDIPNGMSRLGVWDTQELGKGTGNIRSVSQSPGVQLLR